jgi:hypothetical protein
MTSRIEHDDALSWLKRQEPRSARAIILDWPYSRYKPVAGREDGSAGCVAGPLRVHAPGSVPVHPAADDARHPQAR